MAEATMIVSPGSAAAKPAALNPDSVPVDGRTQRDRLAYAAEFARLICYFNSQNQPDGDWQEFFLKDPAILLASISRTDYERYHVQYVRMEQQQAFSANAEIDAEYVNQLCELLQKMFVTLADWFEIMDVDKAVHGLYEFLKHKIVATLATQLWLATGLQHLQHLSSQGKVVAPEWDVYRQFDPIWNTHEDNLRPFDGDGKFPDSEQQIVMLKRVYRKVLDVFVEVIDHTGEAFRAELARNCEYPDTALLRVFCELMEIEQAQINRYGKAHLDFYYEHILKLSPRPAQADEVIVCLTPANPLQTQTLPAATAFLAGSYPDQAPVVFSNPDAETVSGAAITAARTVCRTAAGLSMNVVTQPNVVVRNAAQEIQDWDAFGNAKGVVVQPGFAIASPMLSLQGGTRSITLTLVLAPKAGPAGVWTAADFPHLSALKASLSTASGWFAATTAATFAAPGRIVVTVGLNQQDPPIVALASNPDGYASAWPIMKLDCSNAFDLADVPSITSATLAVTVTDMGRIATSGNIAAAPAVEPAQALGPIPMPGSSFYVALPECLAKPLQSLSLVIPWDNLPANFSAYYLAYNIYLLMHPQQVATALFENTCFKGQWAVLNGNQWAAWPAAPLPPSAAVESAGLSSSTTAPAVAAGPGDVSTVSPMPLFQQKPPSAPTSPQTQQATTAVPAAAAAPATIAPLAQSASGAGSINVSTPALATQLTAAASLIQAQKANLGSSGFALTFPPPASYVPSPELPAAAMPAPALSRDGYLRFQLNAPSAGFGSELYPQVVAYITLVNAQLLIAEATDKTNDKTNDKTKNTTKNPILQFWNWLKSFWQPDTPSEASAVMLLPMPNIPYSPVQSGPVVSYTASSTVDFSSASTQTYPLELYHYGPFCNYLAWRAPSTVQSTTPSLGQTRLSPGGPAGSTRSVPLVPGAGSPGCLYLALSGVSTPDTLTLFVQVSSDTGRAAHGQIGYWYWTQSGWQKLAVLQDGTRGFASSGIVKLALPAVPAAAGSGAQPAFIPSPLMPTPDFWLAISNAASASNIKFSYLNTQAVRLVRSDLTHLQAGMTPWIPAGAISAAPIASIASVVQPFDSYSGLASETRADYDSTESFYRRTGDRLNGKDRVSSGGDVAKMVMAVCPDLYYVSALPGGPGQIGVAMVRRYANAQLPNAFRPQFGPSELETVARRLAAQASALAGFSVANFAHQEVQIACTLVVSNNANMARLTSDVNQQLKLFLSPWIVAQTAQMNLSQGLYRADLLNLLSAFPGVQGVAALAIFVSPGTGQAPQEDPRDVLLPAAGSIFVSPPQHRVTIAWADPSTEAG